MKNFLFNKFKCVFYSLFLLSIIELIVARDQFLSSPFDNFIIECPKFSGAVQISVGIVNSRGSKRQDTFFTIICDRIDKLFPWKEIPIGILELEREDCYYSDLFDPLIDKHSPMSCKAREYIAGIIRMSTTKIQLLCCRLRTRDEAECMERKFEKPIDVTSTSHIHLFDNLINSVAVNDHLYKVRFCSLKPRNVDAIYNDLGRIFIKKPQIPAIDPMVNFVGTVDLMDTNPVSTRSPNDETSFKDPKQMVMKQEIGTRSFATRKEIGKPLLVVEQKITPRTVMRHETETPKPQIRKESITSKPITKFIPMTTTTTTKTPKLTTALKTTTIHPSSTNMGKKRILEELDDILMNRNFENLEKFYQKITGDDEKKAKNTLITKDFSTVKPLQTTSRAVNSNQSQIYYGNLNPFKHRLFVKNIKETNQNRSFTRDNRYRKVSTVIPAKTTIYEKVSTVQPVKTTISTTAITTLKTANTATITANTATTTIAANTATTTIAANTATTTIAANTATTKKTANTTTTTIAANAATMTNTANTTTKTIAKPKSNEFKRLYYNNRKTDASSKRWTGTRNDIHKIEKQSKIWPYVDEDVASSPFETESHELIRLLNEDGDENENNILTLDDIPINRTPGHISTISELEMRKKEKKPRGNMVEDFKPEKIEDMTKEELEAEEAFLNDILNNPFFVDLSTSSTELTDENIEDGMEDKKDNEFYQILRRTQRNEKILTFCTKEVATRDSSNLVIACGSESEIWRPLRCPPGSECFLTTDATYRLCCPVSPSAILLK